MISRLFVRLRRLRRSFNRSERAVKWMGLSRAEGLPHEPGLLLIQIDGLGHDQFQRALDQGKLPFLRRLLRREGYTLKSLYAGVPSTTPAVQAELFFGKRTALPAFSYLDPDDGSVVKLFDPHAAKRMEDALAEQAEGLMREGAAYGNIFGGGADIRETHFCVSALGWEELRNSLNPLTFLLLVLMNFMSVLRVAALLLVELGLAVVDFIKGVRSGQDFLCELKFILARVGVSIGLRELIVIGASIDITRGLPIIQLNLAGFDEQAHRRGPSSAFAHWVLRGIDYAIRRLWIEAKHSPARDYRVWIYSDHGQENVVTYRELTGRSIQRVVDDVMRQIMLDERDEAAEDKAETEEEPQRQVSYRTRTLSRRHWQPRVEEARDFVRPGKTRVIALGPVGFVYAPRRLSFVEKDALAATLTQHHKVPCVLGFDSEHRLCAWISGSRLALPEHKAVLIGQAHPFAAQVMDDIMAFCEHPGSGDLVLAGWRDGLKPVTFARENGSHGGFGPHETHGIALLDSLRELPPCDYEHVRALDLRAAALRLLNRADEESTNEPLTQPPQAAGGLLKLRVMTYNVHSCLGMDGRRSTERIARMIGKFDPDVVALQETDNGRPSSGYVHQVRRIAALLNMHYVYFPVMQHGEDEYGNAFLCRWPLELVASAQLPHMLDREPRGILWATLTVGRTQVQLLATHLGLLATERRRQIDSLMSGRWVGRARHDGPTILLGDFNATEKGYAWKRTVRDLHDVQRALAGWKPRKTWFSTHPSLRLDHIFVSDDIRVEAVHRPIGTDFQMASDHLPLVADLVIPVGHGLANEQEGDGEQDVRGVGT